MLYEEIRTLSDQLEERLKQQMNNRAIEMEGDDFSHYVLYQVLGVTPAEGKAIDLYQNKGRFLYKYAGAFLETATRMCIVHKYPDARVETVPNNIGQRPKTFGIDCLAPNGDAFEIKWRDATTDGDHITKEHTRMRAVKAAGYKPIRVMFYYPNRDQAKRIQRALEDLYKGIGGAYYYGDEAWEFVKNYTDIDLFGIISKIAEEKTNVAV